MQSIHFNGSPWRTKQNVRTENTARIIETQDGFTLTPEAYQWLETIFFEDDLIQGVLHMNATILMHQENKTNQ